MKQIRQRFIKIALLALTLAMLLVAGVINAVHYVNTTSELKETLNYLVESENNNTHEKAYMTVTNYLARYELKQNVHYNIAVANRYEPTKGIEI